MQQITGTTVRTLVESIQGTEQYIIISIVSGIQQREE